MDRVGPIRQDVFMLSGLGVFRVRSRERAMKDDRMMVSRVPVRGAVRARAQNPRSGRRIWGDCDKW